MFAIQQLRFCAMAGSMTMVMVLSSDDALLKAKELSEPVTIPCHKMTEPLTVTIPGHNLMTELVTIPGHNLMTEPVSIPGHNLQSGLMKFVNQNEPWKVQALERSLTQKCDVPSAKRCFILTSVVEKFEKATVPLPESLATLVHDVWDDKLCDVMSKRTWETRIQNARQQAHELCD